MRCSYCGTEVTVYPANGICASCGGRLPQRPEGTRCPNCGNHSSGNFCVSCGQRLNGSVPPAAPVQPVYAPPQPVYIPVQQMPYHPPTMACPKCGSTHLVCTKRGFRWGLALICAFLLPVFGLLCGFCGSKKLFYRCSVCNHKWAYK